MAIFEYHKKAWELLKRNQWTVLFFALGVGIGFQLLFRLLSWFVGYQNPYIIFFSDLYACFSGAMLVEEFEKRVLLPEHIVSMLVFIFEHCGIAFVSSSLFIFMIKTHERVKTGIRDVFVTLKSYKTNIIKTYLTSFVILLIPLIANMIAFSLLKEGIGIGSLLLFYLLLLLSMPLGLVAFITLLLQDFTLCEAIFENTGGLKPVFKCYDIYLRNFLKLGVLQIFIYVPWLLISTIVNLITNIYNTNADIVVSIIGVFAQNSLFFFPLFTTHLVFYEYKLSSGKIKVKWSKKHKNESQPM